MCADRSFKNALDDDGRDLSAAELAGPARRVHFRNEEIDRVVSLLDAGHSVLLVGPPAVGKTAIISGVARALAARAATAKGCTRLVEFSTTTLMAGTRYLGEWQSKVTQITRSASEKRTAIHLSDVWNLPRAGRTSKNDTNMLDALRPGLASGALRVTSEATPEQLRHLQRIPRFIDLFRIVHISPLTAEQVDRTLARVAESMDLDIDADVRRSLVALTTRFLPVRPQPGPALGLLEQVGEANRGAGGVIDTERVEAIFSAHTGLPLFVVSRRATRKASEIRAWFTERLIGQQEAVEAVLETIALFKAGLHDPHRPLGTLLFVGPTGVGKTELARCLATFLFGSVDRLLRFDLSEFKDYHSFETLLGSGSDPTRPAGLVDPVRAQPFQVVLLDELEKAHPNIWDLLLPLLDEGRLVPPSGGPVDFCNTIVIATSNVGAEESGRGLGFGAKGSETARQARFVSALEDRFRPEFLNRFQRIVVFHPLSKSQVRAVARQELKRILDREGITSRDLLIEVEDTALDLVIARGYDARYGARALKRVLQRQLVLPLAVLLMEKPVEPGQLIKAEARGGQLRLRLVDTPESRAAWHRAQPVKRSDGGKVGRGDLRAQLGALQPRLAQLAVALGEDALHEQRGALARQREAPNFWQDAEAAARVLRDLDALSSTIERLEGLRERAEGLMADLEGQVSRKRLAGLARGVEHLERRLAEAWREFVYMGSEGRWDALVEIRPIPRRGDLARDLLVRIYKDWARGRRAALTWLCEPRNRDEPAILALKGHFITGFLAAETGLHRVSDGDDSGAARVRVIPWTDTGTRPEFEAHRSLRGSGVYGGRLRSRLVCRCGLVLQNDHTLAENRELASELVGAWTAGGRDSDEVVRRYDLKTPMFRDHRTGFSSGRRDTLSAARFHELLCLRIDQRAAEGWQSDG